MTVGSMFVPLALPLSHPSHIHLFFAHIRVESISDTLNDGIVLRVSLGYIAYLVTQLIVTLLAAKACP